MVRIEFIGNELDVQHTADPIEVSVEIAVAVGSIFNSLKNEDAEAAEAFRSMLRSSLLPNSPVWENIGDRTCLKLMMPKKGDAPTGQSQGTADE